MVTFATQCCMSGKNHGLGFEAAFGDEGTGAEQRLLNQYFQLLVFIRLR